MGLLHHRGGVKLVWLCLTGLVGCVHAGYGCYAPNDAVAKANCHYPGCSNVSCTNSSLNCENGLRTYFCAWSPVISSSIEGMDCSADDCVELDVCIVERDMRRTTAAPENVREEVLSTTFVRTLEIHNGKPVWHSSANLGTKVCWGGGMWNIMSGGKACNDGWFSRMGFIGQTLDRADFYLGVPSGDGGGDTNTKMGRTRCGSGNFCANYDGDTPVVCPHPPSEWPCSNGEFWSLSSDSCEQCDVGTYSAESGSFQCTSCQSGTFAPNKNSTSCTPCPLGSSSLPGSDELSDCNFCDSGFMPLTSTCIMCEAGKYKNVTGNFDCTPCPTGSISGPGSKHVSGCICGRGYTVGDENEHCAACKPGQFKNVTGTGECMSCPLVTHTSLPGAGSMTDCKCKPGFTGSDGVLIARNVQKANTRATWGLQHASPAKRVIIHSQHLRRASL